MNYFMDESLGQFNIKTPLDVLFIFRIKERNSLCERGNEIVGNSLYSLSKLYMRISKRYR